MERRRIKGSMGRRAGERRAQLVPVEPPPELPRRARTEAAQIVFAERVEPSARYLEDLEAARLVARFQAGDERAFADLYKRCIDPVVGYLKLVFRDPQLVEDVSQQIFLRVHQGLPKYEYRGPKHPFRAWLFKIVRNEMLKQRDRDSRLAYELSEEPEELARLLSEERESAPAPPEALRWISDPDLLIFIEHMPIAQRQVIVMRFLLGLRTSEVAEVLGRKPTEISVIQHRALAFLLKRLKAIGREAHGEPVSRWLRRKDQMIVLRTRRYSMMNTS